MRASSQKPARAGWGGARPGAGRKPRGERAGTPHRALQKHRPGEPVLATLRASLQPLRTRANFPAIRAAIAEASRREPARFRVVHFAVTDDRVHLIVEAADERALSAGMRSVSIRIARSLNQLLDRRGKIWADRWHGRALRTPKDVRRALLYVLANFRLRARPAPPPGIDPFSSAAWFDGFRGDAGVPSFAGRPLPDSDERPPVSPPRSRLLASSWRKQGLIGLSEAPPAGDFEPATRTSALHHEHAVRLRAR
jgi:REP element-mobilizing transposase RayT